jgi:hypothetical protein
VLASAPPSRGAPPPPAPCALPPQSEKDARQQKTRRRYRGETAEGEEGDTTPDLLLKHLDATLVTLVRRQIKNIKHTSETLAKTFETIANIRNNQIKHL